MHYMGQKILFFFSSLQVVLKALDPIFDIEDPYAPNIQGLNTFLSLLIQLAKLFPLFHCFKVYIRHLGVNYNIDSRLIKPKNKINIKYTKLLKHS